MARKVFALTIIVLLLSGCTLSVQKPVFDGSPTALNITITRDTVNALAATTNTDEQDYINVRIWKTDSDGTMIYSVARQVPLEPVLKTGSYTLSEVVPSNKQYKVAAIYAKDGVLETSEAIVNAPADHVTNVTLNLKPFEYTLYVPDAVYSGGSSKQFKIEFNELRDLGDDITYTFYLATAPWTKNGYNQLPYLQIPEGGSAWRMITTKAIYYSFPEVYEPAKLYYQYEISCRVGNGWVTAYYPDLEQTDELPYIWIYPSPDWNL